MALKDEALARKAGEGDVDAFEALYDRHHRGVHALCRHLLGSPDEADDAVQHTFGVVFRELSGGTRPEHPRPWIYAIARNRALTVLRGQRDVLAQTPVLSTAGLSEEVERRADLRDLVSDIGRLPEEQRSALILSELGDMPHAEVANVLGCPSDRVRALVYQARSTLGGWREARERSCLEVRSQIVESSGWSASPWAASTSPSGLRRVCGLPRPRGGAAPQPRSGSPRCRPRPGSRRPFSTERWRARRVEVARRPEVVAPARSARARSRSGPRPSSSGAPGWASLASPETEGSGDRTEPPPPAENASAEPEPRQSGSGASGAPRTVQRREAERRARVERSGGGGAASPAATSAGASNQPGSGQQARAPAPAAPSGQAPAPSSGGSAPSSGSGSGSGAGPGIGVEAGAESRFRAVPRSRQAPAWRSTRHSHRPRRSRASPDPG